MQTENATYETVVGLEIHVQLSTQSKAFCGDDARFGGAPNTHIGVVSLAHPGTLPRANKKQIEYAVRLGLALGCEINLYNAFDRKNYFYADLPKGYQITQDKRPVCRGGGVTIQTATGEKYIRLHHIHMEEDAGKSIHDLDDAHTFIDLNRAGAPLVEIVTEPDLRSGEEAVALMNEMRRLVRWLDISDGNMEEGSMRCDCNISIRKKGEDVLNTRCEVKNVNSMRFARRAVEVETLRQIALVESGRQVTQQTLHFEPATGVTTPLRDKENAHDYRYFPDPDLPPIVLTTEYVGAVREQIGELPRALRDRLVAEYGLPLYDADMLTQEKETAHYFLRHAGLVDPRLYKPLANVLINKILPYLHEQKTGFDRFPILASAIGDFLTLIDQGKISASAAYSQLFPAMLERPSVEPQYLADELHLLHDADVGFLDGVIAQVLTQYPQKVAEYKKGKKGLLGFFMGEVMKAAQGKAEPKSASAAVAKALER